MMTSPAWPWIPACAGMTEGGAGNLMTTPPPRGDLLPITVIPAEAGIYGPDSAAAREGEYPTAGVIQGGA